MVHSLLRYVTYLVCALVLFAGCILPLVRFAWLDLQLLNYTGSGGSIIILLLGGVAAVCYLLALLSYPFAASGRSRIFRILGWFGLHRPKGGLWSKVLPWFLASIHFILVPVLTVLPLLASAEGSDEVIVLAIALVVFVGTGAVHHAAFLLSLTLFPRAKAPETSPPATDEAERLHKLMLRAAGLRGPQRGRPDV